MGIVLWIVFGGLAGAIARLVMPGPRAGGVPIGILLGLSGAMLGGLLGTFLAGGLTFAVDVRSALMAGCAALLVLLCYRSFALRYEEQPWRP